MRGLPSRGYNLMVDLLIYKPFNPFTPPIPPELHRNPLSLLDFALMPVSIRFGKYSPPNPWSFSCSCRKTVSLFVWLQVVIECRESLLMLLYIIHYLKHPKLFRITKLHAAAHSCSFSRFKVKAFDIQWFLTGIIKSFLHWQTEPHDASVLCLLYPSLLFIFFNMHCYSKEEYVLGADIEEKAWSTKDFSCFSPTVNWEIPFL